MKIKKTLYELMKGSNAYISEKQKARIRLDSKPRGETTGSSQTKKMMQGLSQSDYDEIQKKFGKNKPLKRSK